MITRSNRLGSLLDPSTWFDPWEFSDFRYEAENLARQFVLLNRRANQSLPADLKQEFQLVADRYEQFMNEEARRTGSGWYLISDDRKKLANFKDLYRQWYETVSQYDANLQEVVAPPTVSLGVKKEQGLISTLVTSVEKLADNKYTLPILGMSAVFLGAIWIRSGKKR